jgi:CheY-like chemotaxis protein
MISDLAMPEEDGYSLIARIRQLPSEKGGKIPAIALSAFATNESKQRAIECGFDYYSSKPFEPDMLTSDILNVLRQKAQAKPFTPA